MYAIIETGGKQYRISEGEVLKVDKINNISENMVTFNNVLMVSDGDKTSYGSPFLASAEVTAEIVGNVKDKKVLVFKMKPRKAHRKIRGHRQQYTAIRIKNIKFN